MIKTFYEWLTYNPTNIPITKILVPLIIIWLVLAIVFFIIFYVTTRKFTFKTCVASLLSAPYIMLMFFWQICFMDSNTYVQLLPLLPVLAMFFILLFCNRKYKELLKSLRGKARDLFERIIKNNATKTTVIDGYEIRQTANYHVTIKRLSDEKTVFHAQCDKEQDAQQILEFYRTFKHH